jgi:hypothetical protein
MQRTLFTNMADADAALPEDRPPCLARRCAGCRRMQAKREETKKFLLCSACRQAYYCSRACQARDWPAHKTQCGRYDDDVD